MRLTTPEISWHGKEPLFSLDFSLNKKSPRLATSGADSNIRIWALLAADDNCSKVEFMANLSRHTKAVNVVRFSPQGNMLASGGDDCYVIIWKLNEENTDGLSQFANMDGGNIEDKESWQVVKMLRGHIEDVYDLAWSPNATQLISGSVDNSVIIWDTNKGDKLKILKDHRQYVQGVCWDPCGSFVASYSCDRTCRIYNTSNFRCLYNINKMTLPANSSKTEQGTQNSKQIKIFHDETMPSFFRRLTFSPDGLLLLVPGGKFEVTDKAINTTFVFTKASMNKPVLYFPATKKPTIAVKCCPVLFELRDKNMEIKKSVFKLPYRIVVAVASLDSVVLYDTQRTLPFAFLSNMHYASLTDIAWSNDGKILAISSRDGYCSLVTFDDNELGIPYSQTAQEVIENATVHKEISPGKRSVVTPKSKTSDSMKDERIISPKIEKLSIKNFVTVNPPKPTTSQPATGSLQANSIQDGVQKSTAPRRVGFVTIQPTRETQPDVHHVMVNPSPSVPPTSTVTTPATMAISSTTTQPRRVNFTTLQPARNSSLVPPCHTTSRVQNLKESCSSQANRLTLSPSTAEQQKLGNTSSIQQSRRVGFVTLTPVQTANDTSPKTTTGQTQGLNANPTTAKTLPTGQQNHNPVVSPHQPRRVGFVTLTSPQGPCTSQVPPNNHGPTTNQNATVASDEGEGCTPTPNATISSEDGQGCTLNRQPPPPNTNIVTLQNPSVKTTSTVEEQKIDHSSATSNPNPSTNNTSSVTTMKNTLSRQERPPVPLEPTVIILNDLATHV